MTKVLVFESDPKFAGELRTELGKFGCTVQVVDDGNVGLQAASSEKPDLILLSIELPRMNGFSVCNKLKKDAQLKDVPLVIMSSESSEDTFEQHRKLRTRAEDYVHKPIAFGELLEHIRPLVSLDGEGAEPEAIDLDDVEVEEDTSAISVRGRELAANAPPRPPSVGAPPLPPPKGGKVDAEIDDFIGGAFDHLIQEEESTQVKHLPPRSVPPQRDVPPPRLTPPPVPPGRKPGSIAPPSPSVPPPPVTDASVQAYRAIQPPPPMGADPAEMDRLRAELEHAKSEIVKLTKEAVSAHGSASRMEAELETSRDAANEISRLKRELDEVKTRGPAKGGAVSSREFLDLREALNKKDKEILGLRDQTSRRDKELLDVRDQLLSVEREKADQIDKLLELERAREDLTAQVDSLRADRELAAKRADDFKARGEKVGAQLAQRDQDLATARQELVAKEQAHTDALREAGEERTNSIAATEAEGQRQLEAAVDEERQKWQRAVADATAAHAADIERRAHEQEEELSIARREHEQAVANQKREHEEAIQSIRGAHAAEIERIEQGKRGELAELQQSKESELRQLEQSKESELRQLEQSKRSENEQLTAAHARATEEARRAAEAKLEARERELEEHKDAAIATLLAEQGETLKNERDANTRDLETKEAAWSAKRKELDDEIRNLSMDLELTREKLENTEERAASLDAQLITTKSELEQTRGELESTERERTRLEGELSIRTSERDQLLKDLGARTAVRDDLAEKLGARGAELASRTSERDKLVEELGARTDERDQLTVELASARERREVTETKKKQLEAELAQKSELATRLDAELTAEKRGHEETREEGAVLRQRIDALDADLARTAKALERARAKWGHDRASLDNAKKALAAAMTELQDAEGRPID